MAYKMEITGDSGFKLREPLEVHTEDMLGVSVLKGYTAKGWMVMTEPVDGEERCPLKKKMEVKLVVDRNLQVLSCKAVVRKVYKQEQAVYIEVERLSETERQQLRDYVRYETKHQVRIAPMMTAEEARLVSEVEAVEKMTESRYKEKAPAAAEMITFDISGGGMRVAAQEMIPQGTLAYCELSLGGGETVTAYIRIVRNEQYLADGLCVMGAKFISIADDVREKIIRYVKTAQQQEMREQRKRNSGAGTK